MCPVVCIPSYKFEPLISCCSAIKLYLQVATTSYHIIGCFFIYLLNKNAIAIMAVEPGVMLPGIHLDPQRVDVQDHLPKLR